MKIIYVMLLSIKRNLNRADTINNFLKIFKYKIGSPNDGY